MRAFFPLSFLLVIFSSGQVYSQSGNGDPRFTLTGEIIGRDTGSIILWHYDNNNKDVADTLKLDKGKFHLSGTANRSGEALLWTDLKNRDFDDPSVIRFLLEPRKMHIFYKVSDALNPVITGSVSQTEKNQWDRIKSPLLDNKRLYYDTIRVLAHILKTSKDPLIQEQLDNVIERLDSVRQAIKLLDVKYIVAHPASYLSGYLLSQHTRKLSVDSIKMLYNGVTTDVRKSSLGHLVLGYVYPLTDDSAFRRANPLVDAAFDRQLRNIRSVYDLHMRDTAGNVLSLSAFKGKYLVIDFWASWCSPCIANIPALNQMIERYKADAIEFISISLDNDLNAWKQAIVKHHSLGVQLSDTARFTGLAAIYCKVLWVPTYLIAGPDGRIIQYDSPGPGELALKNKLDHLLSGIRIKQ